MAQVVTPDLKSATTNDDGCLLYVDLSNGKSRLGGTALAQVYNQLGNNVPDVEDVRNISNAFIATQNLIKDGQILAGHDVSDGGLVTCLLEMAFAGLTGIDINISHKTGNPIDILFAEEVGWVLEVHQKHLTEVLQVFKGRRVPIYHIGWSRGLGMNSKINISVNNKLVLDSNVMDLFKTWEETSYQLERLQTNVKCAMVEYDNLKNRKIPSYCLSFDPDMIPTVSKSFLSPNIPVAVVREEGINGDREMAASLVQAGFEVWDVTMQDLLGGKTSLDRFRGVIFPGGFSYADVLGSAKGWAASLRFNSSLKKQLEIFFSRKDTFSLGVCNGCQLMSLLGLIGGNNKAETNVLLDHNESERFECRFSTVKIEKSKAIMLKDMENSVLGVWIAHGEGRFTFRDNTVLEELKNKNCLAIRYTDDYGKPTEQYPMNPNGSPDGIAGICSDDGRHLAMMPHPERCTQMWQWPYVPANWQNKTSPWLRIFQNAFVWCCCD